MAALLGKFRNLFTRKNNAAAAAPAPTGPSEANISAAKQRICRLLNDKIQQGTHLDLAETRYALQHCGKTQNNLRTVALLPSIGSSSPISKNLQRRLNTPINSARYPENQKATNNAFKYNVNLRSGGKRKTHKRRHTKKRKHTRKH